MDDLRSSATVSFIKLEVERVSSDKTTVKVNERRLCKQAEECFMGSVGVKIERYRDVFKLRIFPCRYYDFRIEPNWVSKSVKFNPRGERH